MSLEFRDFSRCFILLFCFSWFWLLTDRFDRVKAKTREGWSARINHSPDTADFFWSLQRWLDLVSKSQSWSRTSCPLNNSQSNDPITLLPPPIHFSLLFFFLETLSILFWTRHALNLAWTVNNIKIHIETRKSSQWQISFLPSLVSDSRS